MPESNKVEILALEKASAGLLYSSESDVPFDVFVWKSNDPGETSAQAQLLARIAKDRRIEEIPAEVFFQNLAGACDPGRVKQLWRTLQSELAELKVFRVGQGEVEVDIYIIGLTRSGAWAGLHTMSVET